MMYSVWDHRAKRYDYYEADGATGTHAGTPPSPLMASHLGMTPEQCAWRLPAGARKVGSGTVARGRVAATVGIAMGDFDLPSWTVPVAIGAAALYFWRKR